MVFGMFFMHRGPGSGGGSCDQKTVEHKQEFADKESQDMLERHGIAAQSPLFATGESTVMTASSIADGGCSTNDKNVFAENGGSAVGCPIE